MSLTNKIKKGIIYSTIAGMLLTSPIKMYAQINSLEDKINQEQVDGTKKEKESILKKSIYKIGSGTKRGLKAFKHGFSLGISYYLIPETILHEASHAVAYKSFGVGIEEFKILPKIDDEDNIIQGYVIPDDSYWSNVGYSPLKKSIVDIAPYAFDILIKHRVYELVFNRNNQFGIFDGYLQTKLMFDFTVVMEGTGEGGDIAKFAENIGINKYIVSAALTGLYCYSITRVFKK